MAAKKPTRDSEGAAAAVAEATSEQPAPTPRLKEVYRETVQAQLKEKFGYGNDMEVPKLTKVVISMGVGKALAQPKRLEEAQKHLAQISGQKPLVTRAKQSVSNFRLREGQAIGCKVTLRSDRMYEFLDRLISVAIPRIRDFRGCSPKAFDGRGNYSLGLAEQVVFTEIDADKMDFSQGMNIAICTTAKTNAEAQELIGGLGFPFQNA